MSEAGYNGDSDEIEFLLEQPCTTHTNLQLAHYKIITLKQEIEALKEQLDKERELREAAQKRVEVQDDTIKVLKGQLLNWACDHLDLEKEHEKAESELLDARRDIQVLHESRENDERRSNAMQQELIRLEGRYQEACRGFDALISEEIERNRYLQADVEYYQEDVAFKEHLLEMSRAHSDNLAATIAKITEECNQRLANLDIRQKNADTQHTKDMLGRIISSTKDNAFFLALLSKIKKESVPSTCRYTTDHPGPNQPQPPRN